MLFYQTLLSLAITDNQERVAGFTWRELGFFRNFIFISFFCGCVYGLQKRKAQTPSQINNLLTWNETNDQMKDRNVIIILKNYFKEFTSIFFTGWVNSILSSFARSSNVSILVFFHRSGISCCLLDVNHYNNIKNSIVNMCAGGQTGSENFEGRDFRYWELANKRLC